MNRAWYEHRLQPPQGCVRAVIDTDAGNQIDDQFALVYALLAAERIRVEAIYAAPFVRRQHTTPGQGMRAGYDEINRIVAIAACGCANRPIILHGATQWLTSTTTPLPQVGERLGEGDDSSDSPSPSPALQGGGTPDPQPTPAADDLIRRAMDGPDDKPLYVIAIGAITNIAAALQLEPRLAERMVLVWLAGQPHETGSAQEYNLCGDIAASRFIFESNVPLVQIPCEGVAEALRLDARTLETHAAGRSPIGDELVRLFMQHDPNHPGASKVIWDLAPVAWLIEPLWCPSRMTATPKLTAQMTWQADPSGRPMRLATACRADRIYNDLFTRLANHAKPL